MNGSTEWIANTLRVPLPEMMAPEIDQPTMLRAIAAVATPAPKSSSRVLSPVSFLRGKERLSPARTRLRTATMPQVAADAAGLLQGLARRDQTLRVQQC